MVPVKISFTLLFLFSITSALPNNYSNRSKTAKPSECNYCDYYYETGNSPYQLLRAISQAFVSGDDYAKKDDLLLDLDELYHAEKLFSNYCDMHCPVRRRSGFGGENSGASASAVGSPGIPQDEGVEPIGGASSGAIVSNRDVDVAGGSGTAALSGSGATLTGGSLGDGDIEGSISSDNNGQTIYVGSIRDGGYMSGAVSSGGSASGSSSVNEFGVATIGASVAGGGASFGMSGGLNSSVSGELKENSQQGVASATIYTMDGSSAGGISGTGAGSSGSSSLAIDGKQTVSLMSKDTNSTITGVSAHGEASASSSGNRDSIAGSIASSGDGKGSVAGATGNAAVSNTYSASGLSHAFSAGGGMGGGAVVSGQAAGSSVASSSGIATSISGNTGEGTGSSVYGNGNTNGMIQNGTVVASASSTHGMASTVTSSGKGVAGGSGSTSSGVTMGVANQSGSASGSATGKGASIATSTGQKASIMLVSSRTRGTVATAVGSRSLPFELSRRVKILRKHCDEKFCIRYPNELCCN